ncbi:impC protein, partial [Escherichia coli]
MLYMYTVKEKGDENMIRIEILFDRQSTKNLKS